MTNKIAFVAWTLTKRSKVLAGYLNADIITYKKYFSNSFLRLMHYKILAILTMLKLFHQKYDTIFVQIPPIQAALTTFIYCKITGTKLIFDTHSGIFFPKGLHQKIYLCLYRFITKHITLNIVHNDSIFIRSSLKNAPSVVLEDKISYQPSRHIRLERLKISVICGYGKDEPIQEILVAVDLLPDIEFYFTGDSTKLKFEKPVSNIHLTGYLSDKDYENCLRTADVIVVLTTRPDTVLCGDYEAVGLEKPLITSNTQTLRKYFYKGTIFTSNDSKSIAEAINTATQNLDKLSKEISELKKEKEENWEKQFAIVQRVLSEK